MNENNLQQIANRYDLLCRSTKISSENPLISASLKAQFDELRQIADNFRELGRDNSPDNFLDLCSSLDNELEHFFNFCIIPALSSKFIVGFGGAFSTGKSSLINRLLGERLLVTEVDPTTSLPTYLMRGEENAIHALNLFDEYVNLSEEEFLSLTHDEMEVYGSNVSQLLKTAIIEKADFRWKNIALIDTPGYSNYEEGDIKNSRTDEEIARTQLNNTHAIVWVIDARQGCISEEDLNFLSTLDSEIPRFFVINRADQKTEEDMEAILKVVKATLDERNMPYVDVVAVSARARKNSTWSVDPIVNQLNSWNRFKRSFRFLENIEAIFSEFKQYIEAKNSQLYSIISELNEIVLLAENDAAVDIANSIKKSLKVDKGKVNQQRETFLSFESKSLSLIEEVSYKVKDNKEKLESKFDILKYLESIDNSLLFIPNQLHLLLNKNNINKDSNKIIKLIEENLSSPSSHPASILEKYERVNYLSLVLALSGAHDQPLNKYQDKLFSFLLESMNLNDKKIVFDTLLNLDESLVKVIIKNIKNNDLIENVYLDALVMCSVNNNLNYKRINSLSKFSSVVGLKRNVISDLSSFVCNLVGLCKDISNSEKLNFTPWSQLINNNIKNKSENITAGEALLGIFGTILSSALNNEKK